jgi:hypothetical protein
MSQIYQLPCSCGKSIPVTAAQAGRNVECACGAKITVPSLGALRQLLPAAAESTVAPPVEWSPFRGVMFVGGVLIALLSCVSGGYAMYKASQIEIRDRGTVIEKQMEELKHMPADEIFVLWRVIESVKLESTQGPRAIKKREAYQQWRTAAIASFSIAAAGLVSIVASMARGPR